MRGIASVLLVSFCLGSNVRELTSYELGQILGRQNAFITFHAPWCGHCQSLAPTWEQLAETFEGEAIIGRFDCDNEDHKSLCERLEVTGFPTIKFFLEGDFSGEAYVGTRELEALKGFADEIFTPGCSSGNQEKCTPEQLEVARSGPLCPPSSWLLIQFLRFY